MALWTDWRPDITITDMGGGDVELAWTAPPGGDLATLDGSPGYFIQLTQDPFVDYDSFIGAGGSPPDPTCATVFIPGSGNTDCADLSAVFHDVPYGDSFRFYIEANGDGPTYTLGNPQGGAWAAGTISIGTIALSDSRTVSGTEASTIRNGGARVGIAFNDPTLEPTPTWTYLTDTPNLVAGYEIERGRQFEFDRTDAGTATVRVNDRDGLLDPTNSTSPYFGLIQPLLQIIVQLWNPVTSEWFTRFRGFIEDYDYKVDPSVRVVGTAGVGVTFLEISCVDIFEILTAIEMSPDGSFGDDPTTAVPDATGNIYFAPAHVDDRIIQVEGNAGIPDEFTVVFSGNVNMTGSIFSPGQNVLEVIQEAADAEFPTVSNVYTDRLGRIVFHGRLAKFDPAGTAAGADPGAWDFTEWKCGDGAAVAASPTDTAHIRSFAFNRGLGQLRNSCYCTPKDFDPTVDDPADQTKKDTTSVGQYGIRSWSAEDLRVESGILTGNDAKDECALYAEFVKSNYKDPRNRITDLTFRSMRPDDTGAAANWDLLCRADISDLIDVTVTNPGAPAASFSLEPFFIEGIHETCEPLNGEYADVTLTLDVSPQAYFTDGPWNGVD